MKNNDVDIFCAEFTYALTTDKAKHAGMKPGPKLTASRIKERRVYDTTTRRWDKMVSFARISQAVYDRHRLYMVDLE